MEVVNNLTRVVTDGLEYVNSNKILSAVLGLFLVLYAALAAPKLPKSVTQWFDNTWFKLGFMFLIAYMATKDPSVAIISAVALLVTLQTLSAQKTAENVVQAVQNKVEGFRGIKNLREHFADETVAESEATVDSEAVVESKNDVVGAESEVLGAPVEAESVEAESVQPEVETTVAQPEVPSTEAPPACGASLDEMTGYEAGELATF
jgi:hypothetical protein